jgi:hypothetical protein
VSADSERPLHGLTYDLAADRLREACRVGGVALLASPLLPFESAGGRPIFIWQILSELHPATALAALAPAICGAVLLGAWRSLRHPSLLARLTLLLLATWALVAKLGADAAAWDVVALPDSLNRRIELYVLGIALSGAALRLLAEQGATRASRVVAALSVLTGLWFGLAPGQGEAPVETCVRFAVAVLQLPDLRLVLGYGLVFTIAVFPLLAAGTALSLALIGGGRGTALLAEVVTFGAPGLVFALALQRVLATFGDASVVVTTGLALVLAALLALAARALEVAALSAAGFGQSSDRERAPAPRRFLLVSSSAAVAVLVVMFWLARPVSKGIAWPLGPRSERADRVFGELVPNWALSRARWGVVARSSASAAELAEARAAGNELLRASRELGPELGRAVAELLQGAGELDLAGRRWFRLLEGVNEASRRAGLPYYLDPAVRGATHDGVQARLFLVHPYRVEGVRAASAAGTEYALLGVRRLGEARDGHERLGFSRDHQPFALVVLDEIEPYAVSLGELARRQPPSCLRAGASDAELGRCGAVLQELAPRPEQVRLLVERHELQHQIDGPQLTRSPVVLRALAGYADDAIDEVNRELSAYLAELTTPRVSPKLALVHVMPFVLERDGSALRFVVELELRALSGRPDAASPRELAAIFDELSALSDDALRARARESYEELFDAELPEVKL